MIASAGIVAAWMICGYLIGSIPFGWLIGKARGMDIREHGSKNIGATNCGRVCGWPYGVAAFLLDVGKGFFPALAAVVWLPATIVGYESDRWLPTILIAIAPILGHVFPVFLRLKGGKAVATALGVVLALPMLRWPALAAFGVWCLVTGVTRYVSVGSTAAALTLLAIYLYVERSDLCYCKLPVTVLVILVVAMVIVRHRSNYVRLWKGTESKLWGGRKADERPPASKS